MVKSAVLSLVVLLLSLGVQADPRFLARATADGIELSWSLKGPVHLFRCSQPIRLRDLDKCPWPFPIADLGTVEATAHNGRDTTAASGVVYYYVAVDCENFGYLAGPVSLPTQELPFLERPLLCIDKRYYVMEVWDGPKLVKRYPVVFGKKPMRRKLQMDRASTPEGRYIISQLQPKSQFHRAYDVNYPNAVDKARFNLLGPSNDIGGEIQIHGDGIDTNWTWGCIAMRDDDIDELFEHTEIGVRTTVWIAGGELTWEDLDSDSRAPGQYDPAMLGRWQDDQGLEPTCIYDMATRRRSEQLNDQSFFK